MSYRGSFKGLTVFTLPRIVLSTPALIPHKSRTVVHAVQREGLHRRIAEEKILAPANLTQRKEEKQTNKNKTYPTASLLWTSGEPKKKKNPIRRMIFFKNTHTNTNHFSIIYIYIFLIGLFVVVWKRNMSRPCPPSTG